MPTLFQGRMRNEPLSEIKQGKGASETTPLLSPNDEFAGYENLEWKLLGAKGDSRQYGSYVRHAYRDGLTMQSITGFNPYRFGVVAGSDYIENADSHDGGDVVGSIVHTFAAGTMASYAIQNNRLVTSVGGEAFDIQVYMLGDEYYASRSNEFGNANYEVVPATE